jgi:hypothetical protein
MVVECEYEKEEEVQERSSTREEWQMKTQVRVLKIETLNERAGANEEDMKR